MLKPAGTRSGAPRWLRLLRGEGGGHRLGRQAHPFSSAGNPPGVQLGASALRARVPAVRRLLGRAVCAAGRW